MSEHKPRLADQSVGNRGQLRKVFGFCAFAAEPHYHNGKLSPAALRTVL